MEIREITPDMSLPQGAQEGIVKKLQQSMGRPAPRPAPAPAPTPQPQPVPAQPAPVQPQYKPPAKQVDWLLPQHKPKVVVRPAPERVAFMQPAELIPPAPQPIVAQFASSGLAATPSMRRETPIPLFVPPVQEYEYADTETAYPPQKPAFKLPKAFWKNQQQAVNLDTKNKMDTKTIGKLVGESGIGLALVYFGLTFTGSYYTPASRFAGDLASVFYGYQLGTLMAIIGSILVYDAIRRAAQTYKLLHNI